MKGPFRLLSEARFGPFFWTQFLGALNDNVYKNALIIFIAFELGSAAGSDGHVMINAAAGLFILPFLLFSATAGQIADRYEKATLIRRIKLAEIVIMAFAAVALLLKAPYALIGLLFLMGAQSSLFGPVKYAILPQHLAHDEIVGGNALVEMGTFLAILFGTLLGGLLIAIPGVGHQWVAAVVVGLACLGWWSSRGIPAAQPAAQHLTIRWNAVAETVTNVRYLLADPVQRLSAIGISWFWFYGAILLTQIPNFTRLELFADQRVVTALLTAFSVGIGLGSMMVESLSRRRIVLSVCLFGAVGMSVFGALLPALVVNIQPLDELRGFWEFCDPQGVLILALVVLLGAAGGLYIVPLFALIQRRAQGEYRSRVIAGVNILNALFMIISAVLAAVVLGNGFSISALFAVVAGINAVVAFFMIRSLAAELGGFGAVPENELT